MVKPLLWEAWSRNKDTYSIALVIAPKERFLIANFVLVPLNPSLTLWETPTINAALPPLVLFFFCPFSLLFFSVLLSSFVFSSSSFFSGETLAGSHTLTLAYLPTYLPTKPKYQEPGPNLYIYQVRVSNGLPPTRACMLPPVLHASRQGEQTITLRTPGT